MTSFLQHLLLLLLVLFHKACSQEVAIGSLTTRQHDVAGQVVALSDRVLEIRNFAFDGNAPAAFFWADTSSSPTSRGQLLLDGSPSLNCGAAKLPGADGTMTYRVEFPEGTSLLDYAGGSISVWCERFNANFGEVVIPSSLEGLATAANGPSLECSETPAPDFTETPSGYNCEELHEDLQVRWQVDGDNLNVQLVGRIDEGVYMSFGVSGSDSATAMVGCDAVVADVFEGEFRALDYYMSSQAQCSTANGVCPDNFDSKFTTDTSNVSGMQAGGLTLIQYTRPLTPTDLTATKEGQTVDRTIATAAGVNTFIVWALGPIDADSGHPFFHSIAFTRENVSFEFGRTVQDNCEPFEVDGEVEEEEEVISYYRPIMTDVTEFEAHIGPSAGDRGYVAITGQDAWGISWYINDAIIPIIEMRRGTTYRFLVNGGDNMQLNSQYHPLYLTSSLEGGFAQFFPNNTETVYAGVTVSDDGTTYTADAEGPLCSYEQSDASQAFQDDGTNYPEFFAALDTTCAANATLSSAAGVLEFMPDADTPDLLYYQCVTHRSLGWEIHVIDADAPSALEVDCSAITESTIELATGITLNTIINPQTNTLQAEMIYEGLAWISIAFTADQAIMPGAEAVMGLPDEPLSQTNPGKYFLGDRSLAAVTLMPDERQTLQNASISQNETHTMLKFTKLLVEDGEHPIDLERPNTILWAVGQANAMGPHAPSLMGRGNRILEPAQCTVTYRGVVQNPAFLQQTVAEESTDGNTQTLWAAHGGCAAVAWVILVPLAIGSSVIHETLEGMGLKPGGWFMLHRGLNTLAALLTIIAFAIAVSIIQDAGRAHFTGGAHLTLGLVIFILTLLQALNGIFRPHVTSHAHADDDAPEQADAKAADEEEQDAEEEEAAKEDVPEAPNSQTRIFWEYGHRILGIALLAMAWWQVQSGFGLFAGFYSTDLRGAFWGVVGAITAVIVLVKIYQVMSSNKK